MNKITFDNTRYHLNSEMEQWCHEHIGLGGWHYATPEYWEGLGNKVWSIDSMFGNTTFAFKDQKHYNWFVLRWCHA